MNPAPVEFILDQKMHKGHSRWASTCGRFYARRCRYLGRWVAYDRAQVTPDQENLKFQVVAKARSRRLLTDKVNALLPTLPPRARVSFLRVDGSVFRILSVNPDGAELSALAENVGGTGRQWPLDNADLLVPGTMGYIAWSRNERGHWESFLEMSPAQALDEAMAFGDPGDPPGYGQKVTETSSVCI